MKQVIFLFAILSVYLEERVVGCEYGHIDSMHTMCIFKPRMCTGSKLIRSGGVNCLEKQRILEEHNSIRQLIASGKVLGQPAALNMRAMVWDEELASGGQISADPVTTTAETSTGLQWARMWQPPGPTTKNLHQRVTLSLLDTSEVGSARSRSLDSKCAISTLSCSEWRPATIHS